MKPPAPNRSPLDAAPLRVARQSLSDEISDPVMDQGLAPLLLAYMTVILAGLEWWRHLTAARPSPWLFTALAVATSAYAGVKFVRTRKHLKNLRLGRVAERAVAQYVEWFRTAGFFVFHDVPTGSANIDHVLIGRRGVFSIETFMCEPAGVAAQAIAAIDRIVPFVFDVLAINGVAALERHQILQLDAAPVRGAHAAPAVARYACCGSFGSSGRVITSRPSRISGRR